ncbi:cytochrome c oxidase assembly factor 7 isoform X5 [Rhipicephalus microplus]|uniref:cytochrome c oxidase assembly factor 7 isoform X5 n=1 Tax=Rhipicephalus microplus TaxID=6941 RepID=UPI001889353E|nr:cytochrome c oxidase assembly factor 7 homolog isoform X2 [Rhipicephalus microplus]
MPYDLQKEEDVKEFLENLGIEYRFECFKEKKPDGSVVDKAEAQRYYQLGCEVGHAKACFGVGLGLTSPDSGMEQDVTKGLAFFSKACDMGSADGCYFASSLYITGREGLPRDMRRAYEFAMRACDLKNMQACSNVALMYARGQGVKKDASQAERYRAIVNDYNEQLKQNRGIEMEQGIKD